MPSAQWIFASQPDGLVNTLTKELRVSPMLARMLINRGVNDVEQAERFLTPRLDRLHDPKLLHDMNRAVARIRAAIAKGEHIRIQGDYDVDGITSTVLLTTFFRLAGAQHSFAIPRRESDGYGLSRRAVEQARADGVSVIITVDNGITAVEEIRLAQSLGMDVIITDHHTYGDELPPAFATLHPRHPKSTYPFSDLCGCGVAFKLALAVAESYDNVDTLGPEFKGFLEASLALTAMAAVCDVVPLRGENRILTWHGLAALEATSHPGLRALMNAAGVSGPVTTTDIAFKLGPRINAAGRMGCERLAAELLTERDASRAAELAHDLDTLNTKRQAIERDVTKSAKAMAKASDDGTDRRVLVLASEDWPIGVVGIVAARVVDAFDRPAIVLSVGVDGVARGSGRSTRNFHLYNALKDCTPVLTRFGGHAYAAGVAVAFDKIGELRALLNEVAERHTSFGPAQPTLAIDACVQASDLTLQLARDVAALSPCGEGNPEPLLALESGRVLGRPRLVGKRAQHLSFMVALPEGPGFKAIGFGLAEHAPLLDGAGGVTIAFLPRVSTWSGREELELEVKKLAAC